MPNPPAFSAALGQAAKARREELNLTQEQIFLSDGIQQRWISQLENGKHDVRYFNLRRLATALGLPTSQLIARAEQIEAEMEAAPQTQEAL